MKSHADSSYGRDMQRRPVTRIGFRKRRGLPGVELGREGVSPDAILGAGDLAAGREELGITRSTWAAEVLGDDAELPRH